MQVRVTNRPGCPGLQVSPSCRNFGAKTGKVLGKLGSVDHPKCRQYRQKPRPTEALASNSPEAERAGAAAGREKSRQLGTVSEGQRQIPAGFAELLSSSCNYCCVQEPCSTVQSLERPFLFFPLPHINNNPTHGQAYSLSPKQVPTCEKQDIHAENVQNHF